MSKNTALNSYVKFNENLSVSLIKVESELYDSLATAKKNRNLSRATTVLYTNFLQTLDAFYFSPDNAFAGTTYSVYRKIPTQTYWDFVCEVSNENQFTDYNVVNSNEYQYMVVVSLRQSNGNYMYQTYQFSNDDGDTIPVKWNSWSICNIEESDQEGIYYKVGDTWLLGLNLTDENLTQNLDITAWDTLGQYPKISKGVRNYDGATFTSLLGQMERLNCGSNSTQIAETGKYTEAITPNGREVEKLIAWKEFCNDGELKLLKDIKGNSWVVQIVENPTNNINSISYNMPTTISFSWKEVLNINDISIITVG